MDERQTTPAAEEEQAAETDVRETVSAGPAAVEETSADAPAEAAAEETADVPEATGAENAAADASADAAAADGAAAEETSADAPAETAVDPATAEATEAPAVGEAEAQAFADATDDGELKAVIEAIVYVTEEPATVAQLATALRQPEERIKRLVGELVAEFAASPHGVMVREVAGGYKMTTKPEHHEAVRTFVKSLKPPLKLSLPALETLATIAYKQPITAPEIMEIRGVQGAGVLKTLLDRKLIHTSGRKNVIGRPILYRTTKEFLVQFGLKDLSELPTLKEFEELRRLAAGGDDEEPAEETPVPETPAAEAPVPEAPVAEPPAPAVEVPDAAPEVPPQSEPAAEAPAAESDAPGDGDAARDRDA